MRKHAFFFLAAAALAATAFVAPAQQSQRPAQRDWTRTVVQTPEGGFRMGNPDARVKVVEYLSLTCPHCADFSRTGGAALIDQYVRSGRASLEIRNFVLNGVDVTASLLARCGGADLFFPITGQFLAAQEEWMGRIQGLSQAQWDQISALPPDQRLPRLAEVGGLTDIAVRHGVSAHRARACLTDEAALGRLGEMARAASGSGINGTPTFLINGNRVGANDWGGLEPLIRQAAG
ncbi:thioredoxin domain-containing protein [Sphingosinicella sp. CPCC 101087]|uniref:thioredoxin domain-containing protein n=1 Tax=Sphingosinicella sp. CPCC 101087 TaxID=2497754 RepID=UPI0013EDB431|nr:thioredoxin domain-containing protein [Sphingosinicella sp. CPCC 101087]